MGRILRSWFSHGQVCLCRRCRLHIAENSSSNLVSTAFQGSTGRAYLYNNLINVDESEKDSVRAMTSGVHIVKDAICMGCGTVLGWKYIRAIEEDQRYKEGKWCIERSLVHDIELDNSLVTISVNYPYSELDV